MMLTTGAIGADKKSSGSQGQNRAPIITSESQMGKVANMTVTTGGSGGGDPNAVAAATADVVPPESTNNSGGGEPL